MSLPKRRATPSAMVCCVTRPAPVCLIVDQLSYRGTVGARPDVREVGAHDQCQPPLVGLRAREERVSKRYDDEQRVVWAAGRRARRVELDEEPGSTVDDPAPHGRPTARPRAAVTWLRLLVAPTRPCVGLRPPAERSPAYPTGVEPGSPHKGSRDEFWRGAGRFGVEPGSPGGARLHSKMPVSPAGEPGSPLPPWGAGLPTEGSRPKFLAEPRKKRKAVQRAHKLDVRSPVRHVQVRSRRRVR